VNVAERGKLVQSGTIPVAPTENLNQSVWYDEMLVKGDLVYVIGYRYGVQASDGTPDTWAFGVTEVSSFRLATNGSFERLKSLYIESSDYFSGSNYASRMVEGELVFYTPYALWQNYWQWGCGASSGGTADCGAQQRAPVRFPRYFEPNSVGRFDPKGPI